MSKKVLRLWWEEQDLYMVFEDGSQSCFKDAILTSFEQKFPEDSGIESEEVELEMIPGIPIIDIL